MPLAYLFENQLSKNYHTLKTLSTNYQRYYAYLYNLKFYIYHFTFPYGSSASSFSNSLRKDAFALDNCDLEVLMEIPNKSAIS